MGKDTEAAHLKELAAITTVEGPFLANTTPMNRTKGVLAQLGRGKLPLRNRNYRAWRERIRELALGGAFDVIHVDFYQTSRDVPGAHATPMVISCHDLWLKLELRKAGVRAEQFCAPAAWPASVIRFRQEEDVELRKYGHIVLYSEFDAKLLNCVGEYRTTVVQPVAQVEELLSLRIERANRIPRSISFAGALDRPVNRDAVKFFVTRVMPEIVKTVPDATFHVYGANATADVRAICDGTVSIFHGYVTDIADAFARHEVAVSPLFLGGGLIFKNLQAMATGTPLITTRIANEGIGAVANDHVLIADDADAFVNALVSVFRSPQLWDTLSARAKAFVTRNFSWDANARKFESVLLAAARGE